MQVPVDVLLKAAEDCGLGIRTDDDAGWTYDNFLWYDGDKSDFANTIAAYQRDKDVELCRDYSDYCERDYEHESAGAADYLAEVIAKQ